MGEVRGVYKGASFMPIDSRSNGNGQSGGIIQGSGTYEYVIRYDANGFTGITWAPGGNEFSEELILSMTQEQQLQLAQTLPAWNWQLGMMGNNCVTVTEISE